MGKRLIFILIGLFLIVLIVVVAYFFYNTFNCTVENSKGCNRFCETDNDCKKSGCGCINVKENMYNPSNVDVMCAMANCRCINNECQNIEVNHECEFDDILQNYESLDDCCNSFRYSECHLTGEGYWDSESKTCKCESP